MKRTLTIRQVREAYPTLLSLSNYREDGAGGRVRNFLRGQPKAKRAVVKLLMELRPLYEASDERIEDINAQFRDDPDKPAQDKMLNAHLAEQVEAEFEPLRATLLDERSYNELPAHTEFLLGPTYLDDLDPDRENGRHEDPEG